MKLSILLSALFLIQPALSFAETVSAEGDAQVIQTGGGYYGDYELSDQLRGILNESRKDFESRKKLLEVQPLKLLTAEDWEELLKKNDYCPVMTKEDLKVTKKFMFNPKSLSEDDFIIIEKLENGDAHLITPNSETGHFNMFGLRRALREGRIHAILKKCEPTPSA